ncbi:ribonuclease T2-like [Tulasnella sp. 418]|nr:ribonuclease T2-like [Tulasnella sp. 418]
MMKHTSAQVALANLFFSLVAGSSLTAECPDPPTAVSCTNPKGPSCCFTSEPGQFSLYQRWDREETTWLTIALRSLTCEGFHSTCKSPTKKYSPEDISQYLAKFKARDQSTLALNPHKLVLAPGVSQASLIASEWERTGACINTLSKSCGYTKPSEELGLFHKTLVSLATTLDTAHFLSVKRIYPSETQSYPKERIVDALHAGSGLLPMLQCRSDEITGVEYVFVTRGLFQDMHFESPKHIEFNELAARANKYPCPSKVRLIPKAGFDNKETDQAASAKSPNNEHKDDNAKDDADNTPG